MDFKNLKYLILGINWRCRGRWGNVYPTFVGQVAKKADIFCGYEIKVFGIGAGCVGGIR